MYLWMHRPPSKGAGARIEADHCVVMFIVRFLWKNHIRPSLGVPRIGLSSIGGSGQNEVADHRDFTHLTKISAPDNFRTLVGLTPIKEPGFCNSRRSQYQNKDQEKWEFHSEPDLLANTAECQS
jgi:hypothetical protein